MLNRYEEFTSSVAMLNRYIQKIERAEMAHYGLKGAHAQCLLTISRYPHGITAAQICDICDKDKAAVSRTVAELEAAGMILRPNDAGKRYRLTLRLTPRGSEVAEQIKHLAALAVEQADSGLTEEKRTICYESLNLIAENLRRIIRDGLQENG